MAICKNENCRKRASFGYEGHPMEYCASHKEEGMFNLNNKRCKREGCAVKPSFGPRGSKGGVRCREHKEEGDINVNRNMCGYEKCDTTASFNYPDQIKGVRCSVHKMEGYVNIEPPKTRKKKSKGKVKKYRNRTCSFEGCTTTPRYNIPGSKTGIVCVGHKDPLMIDVITRRCEEEECMKFAIFGVKGTKTGLRCSSHKVQGDVNTRAKVCEIDGCGKQPSYGEKGIKIRVRCSSHKGEDMIRIDNVCTEKGCYRTSWYNLPYKTKRIYCSLHKKDNMVGLFRKDCSHRSCKKLAVFGMKGSRAYLCFNHRTDDSVNIVEDSQCSVPDCLHMKYLLDDKGRNVCFSHCPKKMRDLVNRTCKYHDADPTVSYVCDDCTATERKKEYEVVRYLKKRINIEPVLDSSSMLQGCSRRRPDMYYDLDDKCVIVEVDENEHTRYEDSCECARINEIVSGIGGRPITLIRYNPDTVKHKGKKLKIDKKERLDTLVETLKECLDEKVEGFCVKVIQLYYSDDYLEYRVRKEEDITDKVAV